MLPVKHNYLNNKDLLNEIEKSKISYCQFTDPKYKAYDIVVNNTDEIKTAIEDGSALNARHLRLALIEYVKLIAAGKKIKKAEILDLVDKTTIDTQDIVFRYYTYDHIPTSTRKKNIKNIEDKYEKVNFKPFQHYIFVENSPILVGKSHHKNDIFSITSGQLTTELAKMLMVLVNRFAQKSNWRGYSYIDEMKSQALLQLSSMSLKFDERVSDNPFSYLTSIATNSFTQILNAEEVNQTLRDDLLIMRGYNPSYTRQLDDELASRSHHEEHDIPTNGDIM